jgi:glycerol-3-phosphate dehydrogenase (NAD(P)+)
MGTAFGAPLIENGHEVRFWGPERLDGERLAANAEALPHPDLGVPLPGKPALATTDLAEALEGAELCAVAVASEGIGEVCGEAARVVAAGVPVLVFTKGFAQRDGEIVPVSAVAEGAFGEGHAVIGAGGPVKAGELARRTPTHTVYASPSVAEARRVAEAAATSYYLPTVTDDLVGVEVCAALKNCYAIAVNAISGRDGSANLRALAFGAALREMSVFVSEVGGRPETVAGAAGSGDLYVTCASGRNGDFGRLLGDGHPPEEALKLMEGATVEGLGALPPALKLARGLGIEGKTPVLHHLDEVLRTGGTDGGTPLAKLVSGEE